MRMVEWSVTIQNSIILYSETIKNRQQKLKFSSIFRLLPVDLLQSHWINFILKRTFFIRRFAFYSALNVWKSRIKHVANTLTQSITRFEWMLPLSELVSEEVRSIEPTLYGSHNDICHLKIAQQQTTTRNRFFASFSSSSKPSSISNK